MRDPDKIKLDPIEVKLGEKTVTFTIEQVRELSDLLNGFFGDDSTKIVHGPDYLYPRVRPDYWYPSVMSSGAGTTPTSAYNDGQWTVISIK